jgi:hypothetical protein
LLHHGCDPAHGLNLPIQAFLNQGLVCPFKLLFAETNQATVDGISQNMVEVTQHEGRKQGKQNDHDREEDINSYGPRYLGFRNSTVFRCLSSPKQFRFERIATSIATAEANSVPIPNLPAGGLNGTMQPACLASAGNSRAEFGFGIDAATTNVILRNKSRVRWVNGSFILEERGRKHGVIYFLIESNLSHLQPG